MIQILLTASQNTTISLFNEQTPAFINLKHPQLALIFHRKRRSWEDDKDLMMELHSILIKLDGPYDYFDKNVIQFKTKIESFIKDGFQENLEVFFLCMWIREQLSELTIKQGNYNLQVDPLILPTDINEIIRRRGK